VKKANILFSVVIAINVVIIILLSGALFLESFKRRVGKNLFTFIYFGVMLELLSCFFIFIFFFFQTVQIYNFFFSIQKVQIAQLSIRISLGCFHPAEYALFLIILSIGFIFFAVLLLNW